MSQKFNPDNPFKNQQDRVQPLAESVESKGLKVEHYFSTAGVHPFDELEWEKRSAKITSDSGEVIFEQDDIAVPTAWSQLATKVVSSKYFYGDCIGSAGR